MSMIEPETITIIAIVGVAFTVFLLALIIMARRNKGKICVRIKYPVEEKIVWKKPQYYGQRNIIVIEPPKGKKPGWSFDFTNQSLITKRAFMKSYYALDVFPGATHACIWNYDLSNIEQPRLTRREAREINFLEGFKARYRDIGRGQGQIFLYLLIVGNLILGVFILLVVSGKVRIA